MRAQTIEIADDTVMEAINAMVHFGDTPLEYFGTEDPREIARKLYEDFHEIAKACYGNYASNFDGKTAILKALEMQYKRRKEQYLG